MTCTDATQDLIDTLTLNAHGLALAATALALAGEVDSPPRTKDGTGSITSAAKALAVVLAELVVIGAKNGNSGQDESRGWSGIAAVPDLSEVRDAPKPGKANTRGRGRGGGKAAG